MDFWGCWAGIRKDLSCTSMSRAAQPRHCLPSLRHGSYPSPLSSANARGRIFIFAMKNHVKVHLSPYNRKTRYIFCLSTWCYVPHTHHMDPFTVYLHHQKCWLVTAPHAPYCWPSSPTLRLCSLLLTPLTPPTTATLKLQCLISTEHFLTLGSLYKGEPKKTGFSLKKKIYLYFKQKTLNPLQNTLHWRQYTCPIFFPTVWSISGTAEAWCCWVPPAKLFSPPPRWQISFVSMFFSLLGIKRNHRGLCPVNRVGGDRRSIPERPNTGSQTKLCELGCCHDGEASHPISTILGVFFPHSLSITSKPPSKIPDLQSVQEERNPSPRFLEHRKKKQWASFSHLTSRVLLFSFSVK